MNVKYFYLLPLLFSALSLHAQQACLDFEDFPSGPAFGPVLNNTPGDTLFSQDGLIAIAREIQYLNGNTGFGNAAIEGANVTWLDWNFLFMGNNALELQYPEGVQQVCFDFFDGGGEENFSVNGSDVEVLTGFPDIAGMDFPGVDVTVTLDSSSNNTFLSAGTVCITGEVFSLSVGGQEFGVDNVCATPFDNTNTGDCLAFEMMDTLGYGAQAGTPPGTVFYTESDVAMRLAPVQTLFWSSVYGDLWVRQVADVADFTQASGQFLEFASINSIYDFTAYPEPVEQVTVDYYYTPDGDGTINFAANGAALLIQFVLEPGFYPLAPGVTLEVVPDNNINSSGQLIFEGNVQSLLIGGVAGLHIDNVCINPPPTCDLQELIVQAGDCNPNGVFEVTIDIEYDGLPTDTLQLFTNGNYQLYAAGDFPITLSPFIAPTDEIEFKVSAFGQPDCFLTKVLPAQDCGADCTLEGIVMEGGVQCFQGGYSYRIILVVEGAQEGDTLTVSAQETNYVETLIYNGQQLVLDLPFPAEQFEVLNICDFSGNGDCCKEISIDVDCPDCIFLSLSIDNLSCDGDSLFYFELDFDVLGAYSGEFFKVETSNGFLETYAYADLPVTVGPVLGYGEPVTVWVYDTEGDCGASQTIITPDCADGCVLDEVNLLIPAAGCNNNGEYNLVLDLEYSGVPTSFEVSIPGLGYSEVYGLNDFPLAIPGLPGDGETYQVNIGATDCNAFTEKLFDAPACNVGCIFNNVIAEPHPCEDGTFLVDIEVQVSDPGDLGYFIFADGEIFGPFDYSEPFVTLGPFAGDGVTVYDFLILDFANPTCFGYVEVGPKSCDENNDCQILALSAIPQDCNENGTYDLLLDIEVEEPQDDLLFWFYRNGVYSGQSTLAALPGLLINVPLEDTDEITFKACIFDQPDCCKEVVYTQPECFNNNCPIDNATIDFAFCDSTGFYVELDFDGQTPNTVGAYKVFGNGEVYDTLSYDEPRPIVVGPFDPFTDNIYELIVADLEQPNCSDFVEFSAFDCEEGQDICIDFSAFEGFAAAGSGNDAGLIGTASGVEIRYEAPDNNAPFAVELLDNPYNAFSEGDSSVLRFSNAKVGFEAGPLPGSVSSRTMTMDFHFPVWVDSIQIFANDNFQSIFLPLPNNPGSVQLGDGITMSFDYSTPATTGKITVEGPLESFYISLLPDYTMVLDNLCWTSVTDEAVWPGDANADNLAHHIDLLSIGIGYGASGPTRVNQDNAWSPIAAMDWDSTFANGTNYKHADCNGDGLIDEADRLVLADNYGLSHGVPEPVTELPGTDLDPPAFIDFPVDQPNGATFQAPILIGEANAPVQNAYGVAFTVQFDPEVISPDEIEVVYPTSWFGEPGINTLAIDKVYPDGRIEIAMTRTDQNNVSGHGQVAYIIGIIDDIAGLTQSKVSVEKTYCIDLDENRLPIQGRETTFKVVSNNEPKFGEGIFKVFPNPATDWVNIVSPHGFEADQVQLLNLNGQVLSVPVEDNRRISLANLSSGVYLVRIATGKAVVHKRIVKE